MNKKIAIVASWNLMYDSAYYISSTHYVYLKYVTDRYEKVYLLSSIKKRNNSDIQGKKDLSEFLNLEIIELPEIRSYLSAQKDVAQYYKKIKEITAKVDYIYCRVPDPFSWMPALLFRKKVIMHFVGDTIDATWHNESWKWWKKLLMIVGYLPDYGLALLAAKRSKVYTNGNHLATKLRRYGIKALPVVSSTVSEKTLLRTLPMVGDIPTSPHLIYIGYIRFAKGMKLLMQLWLLLKKEYSQFKFDVVGGGEMFAEIAQFVSDHDLANNVILHGHIDDRERMNELLRSADLFIFPSLSEGSPRVVIEAMAQGIPVVSTPVGSLPTAFTEGDEIRFFDFNDADTAFYIIHQYMADRSPFIEQRNRAFCKVKDHYTIENFLSQVFNYEA